MVNYVEVADVKCQRNINMENSENPEKKIEENVVEPVVKKKKKKINRYCCIPECKTRIGGTMHRFPKDEVLRKKWIKACKFTKVITDNTTLCNNHFLPTDFIPRWDRQLKRLKSIAIPSQNLPSKLKKLSPAQLKKAEERAERAAKRLTREDPRYEQLIATKVKVEDKNVDPVSPTDSDCQLYVKPNQVLEPNRQSENVTQNFVNVIRPQHPKKSNMKKQIIVKPAANSAQPNFEHNYSNNVCRCGKDESHDSRPQDSPEIRAARVLYELHEKIFAMILKNEITYTVKDIVLKMGEAFYFAARKYMRTNFTSYIRTDDQLYYYTGIDLQLLQDIEKAMLVCEGDFSEKQELKISDRIILCLMKLRINLSFYALGGMFYLSEQTCETVFYSTLQTLKVILRSAIYWPTKDEILKSMPEAFEDFKKTVTVLDCTEIAIEKSTCSGCGLPHVLVNEKSQHLKFLLGFSKSGLITYVGRAVNGRISSQIITDESYISKVLVPSQDAIMTDGFLMEEECNRVFIGCIKNGREKRFCPDSTLKIQSKSVIETYIQNTFRRFAMFKIFSSAIPYDMVPYVDDISVVISGIINLSNPSVANKKF